MAIDQIHFVSDDVDANQTNTVTLHGPNVRRLTDTLKKFKFIFQSKKFIRKKTYCVVGSQIAVDKSSNKSGSSIAFS